MTMNIIFNVCSVKDLINFVVMELQFYHILHEQVTSFTKDTIVLLLFNQNWVTIIWGLKIYKVMFKYFCPKVKRVTTIMILSIFISWL